MIDIYCNIDFPPHENIFENTWGSVFPEEILKLLKILYKAGFGL